MMNEDLIEKELSESVLTLTTDNHQNTHQNYQIRCQGNKLAVQGCVNEQCTNNAFICSEEQCQCNQKHQKCCALTVKRLLKFVNSKKVSIEFLQTFLNNKVEEIIDSLSKFQQNTKTWIHKQFQFLGLNQNETNLLNSLKTGNTSNVTGQTIWKIMHPQMNQVPTNQFIQKNLEILKSHFQEVQIFLLNKLQRIKSEINTYHKKIFESHNVFISSLLKSQRKSQIVTSQKEALNITSFFQQRKIQSMKLVYKASENNFEAKKFHQKCDGLSNTLVVVQTQFGKKIGGYTPLKWSSPNSGCYSKDDSNLTFLFSLTNGHILSIQKKDHAIVNNSEYGPVFGSGNDLCIQNKANANSSSFANIGYTFTNQKYKKDDKSSWENFCGNPNSNAFKVKQYEVWSIKFI